jgi:hypothetical protein
MKSDREGDSTYSCFFPALVHMRMCGAKAVYLVDVIELPAEEPGCYWAWWDLERDPQFHYTNSNKMGVTICFPYAISFYEKRGDGLLLPVAVQVVRGPIPL